jgi:glycosyltransferase involved in cell wall biosynthesis
MDAGLLVDVVIPVFNDAERLRHCLKALAHQTLAWDRFTVWVVDNNSDQPLQLEPQPFRLTLRRCSEPGSYAARNAVLSELSAPWVAFTDADCLPATDWLEQGLQASIQSQGLFAGAIRMLPSQPEEPSLADRLEIAFGMRQDHYVHQGGFGITANLWVQRPLFDLLGRFDALRKSGADREFCLRARAAGIPVSYVPSCLVTHPARSEAELYQKARRLIGGRVDAAGGQPHRQVLALVLHSKPLLREWFLTLMMPLPWRTRLAMMQLLLQLRLAAAREWLRLVLTGQVSHR